MAETIRRKLAAALAPSELKIEDDSAKHAGHSGARPGGETHYNVHIVSPAFVGKSRIERHRMVNALLAAEFASGLHALAIVEASPDEA